MDPQQLPPPIARKSTKKLLIIAGSIILVIAIIVVVVAALTWQNVQTPQQVQRPGYNNIAASILDPAPLKAVPTAQAATAQGATVIQACNLLTLDDLAKQQLYIAPNPLASFTRSYFNNQGTGLISKEQGIEIDSYNYCDYPLQNKANVSVTVLQTGYNTMKLSSLLSPQADVQGYRAYSQPDEDDGEMVDSVLQLSKGDMSVEIRTNLAKNEAQKKQQLIDAIVKNLNAQLASPTGPTRFGFESPAFQGNYANACDISQAEDFNTVFGVPPAPFVSERLGTAVGAIRYTSLGDKNTFAYIESACSRYTGEEYPTDRKKLDIETRSYTSDQAAKLEMQANRQPDAEQPTSQLLGDESYVATATDGLKTKKPGSVVFRKGRIVVTLSFNDPAKDTEKTIMGQNKQLETIANAIAGRMNF